MTTTARLVPRDGARSFAAVAGALLAGAVVAQTAPSAAPAAPPAVVAAAADAAALRAVADLAQINGEALACRDGAAAQRAKAAMLAHAPKTPRYASAYEEGTQTAFVAQTRGDAAACADATTLGARIDDAVRRLQVALAGPAHARSAAAAAPAAAAEPLPPRSVPRYLLQGPGGRGVTSEDFRGRFQLVTFGYTGCPDVCPTTMLELKEVLALLGEPRAAKLQPIFMTVDPQRDTPAVLDAYARGFDARILALGGNEALVRRAADAFRVSYEQVREPGAAADAYTIDHTVGLVLLGPDGQLLERIAYGTPAREIAARVEAWMSAAAAR